MALKIELKSLVDELDRVHSGASPWSEEVGIPEFATAANGLQRYFTRKARQALWQLSINLHENRPPDSLKIEPEEYEKVVRQAIADMHAEDEFAGFDESDQNNVVTKMKLLIEDRLASISNEYTHYFPAWTLGMEKDSSFSLGPVMFLNRIDWLDSVDFHQQAKDTYLNQPEENHRWKEIIKEALRKPNDESPIEGLANAVFSAITSCPAMVKVTVRGYELKFSRKLARLVAKTALDAISLGIGPSECFQQQALEDERLPSVDSNSIVETKGYLWLPGYSLGKRFPSMPRQRVTQALADMDRKSILSAFGGGLEGLLAPSNHNHPKLANRWATALDWFGEGNRESNDAIALAKLGTCLDVLACGGKYGGICDMVINLTGKSKDTTVVTGSRPRTLGQLVKDIYDLGRSQILHGTRYNRLESFSVERNHAAFLARIALIESAIRLQKYHGPDEDKAFRTI